MNQLHGTRLQPAALIRLAARVWGINLLAWGPHDLDSVVVSLESLLATFPNQHHAITSFDQLYMLIDILRNPLYRATHRTQLPRLLRPPWIHALPFAFVDAELSNSIELAWRIWLMVGIQLAGYDGFGGEPVYLWATVPTPPLQTIDSAILALFPRDGQGGAGLSYDLDIRIPLNNAIVYRGTVTSPNTVTSPDLDRTFNPLFTLWDMERLADFEIAFTSNLLNHLYMQKSEARKFRPTIHIFQHAKMLGHLRNTDLNNHDEFLQETLDTLALLIPPAPACQRWWTKRWRQSKGRDGTYAIDKTAGHQRLRSRRVRDFHYWRPRLLLLEQEFDNSSPHKLASLWHDRRRGREWATLWGTLCAFFVAAVALVIAAVSTAYGIASQQQGELANAYASNASTSAVQAALASGSSGPGAENAMTTIVNNCFGGCCAGCMGDDSSSSFPALIRSFSSISSETKPTNDGAQVVIVVETVTTIAVVNCSTITP